MVFEQIESEIQRTAQAKSSELIATASYIHRYPELGYEEMKACQCLMAMLSGAGFAVEPCAAGMPSAFVARKPSGRPGPVVAFVSEYDALPGLGHACGHNLIGAAGCGAGMILGSVIDQIGGEVRVVGAPAEEAAVNNAGGKVRLLDAGVFADVDAAIMVHPSLQTVVNVTTTAREALEISFSGQSAHAAGPEQGINALDALLQMFNMINVLRGQLMAGGMIHGIITDGGKAPNIIPDYAAARLYVRARNERQLIRLVDRIMRGARGIEVATGARVSCHTFAHRYLNMVTNSVLAEALADSLEQTGMEVDRSVSYGSGSTDMGNVSHVVPAVHASVGLPGSGIAGHSEEFAKLCGSRTALEEMVKWAQAMAMTGARVLGDGKLRAEMKAEFEAGQ